MIAANNTDNKSWIAYPDNTDFPIQNIPFGIFQTKNGAPRAATIIGDKVIDLAALSEAGFFDAIPFDKSVFKHDVLNDFIALGKPITRKVRDRIAELFNVDNMELKSNQKIKELSIFEVKDVLLLMPVKVGDYTDFYSSIEHATNVGTMFRDPKNALLPNWKHLPVGYHGRSSSIVISGTDIYRPKGQTKADDAEKPSFGPTRLLDFELEMAFVIGKETNLGDSISTSDAEEHIFGLLLFNDWSARDIQKWEYVPLGPFLAKNFASSVSPWIVTLDALGPFQVEGPEQKPEVLPYLKQKGKKNFDINLEVLLQPDGKEPFTISRSNYKYMYWSMNQQLAHHTVNGCNVRIGDMMASGTISGPDPGSYGSMLELTWQGKNPIKLPDGTERRFINDNDSIIMKGYAEKNGLRIGFGEVKGKILPAK